MSVSIKDVAKKAGVSLGTVSNVINRPDAVSPKTLKKVESTIKELGFIPNASARTLRAGKNKIIGLVVPDISNPFFTEVAKGVNEAALKAGYSVILCNTDESSEKENQYLDVLEAQNVKCILITPARDTHKSVRNLLEKGTAVGLLDRDVKGTEVCSVGVKDSIGGELALNHLVELGHREILVLTGASNIPQVAQRDAGIKSGLNAIAKENRPTLTFLRLEQMTSQSAHKNLELYLSKKGGNFTAIICGNDLIALGAIRALRDYSLSVPKDVSIIGYDDIDFAENANVPLTTIAQPKYQLGFAAAELVINESEAAATHAHQRIEFQPQLIVRESTTKAKGFNNAKKR